MDLYGDPDECAAEDADNRLLDRLGSACVLLTPADRDDELVALLIAWRNEHDDDVLVLSVA